MSASPLQLHPARTLISEAWTARLGELPRVSFLPGVVALAIGALSAGLGLGLLAAVHLLASAGLWALALRLPGRLPGWVPLAAVCFGGAAMTVWGVSPALAGAVPETVAIGAAQAALGLAALGLPLWLGPDQSTSPGV